MIAVTTSAQTGGGRVVVELECGGTVYPPAPGPGPGEGGRARGARWRATWYEDGQRRQCEAATEERLAARLDKVTERLAAGAPNMARPGADLIAHYLCQDWRAPRKRWSPKHADTQRRLC